MLRAFLLSASAVVGIYGANAASGPPLPSPLPPPIPLPGPPPVSSLTGNYFVSGTSVCMFSRGGFDSSFQAIGTNVWSSSFAEEGIWTFNGDGTGTAKLLNVGLGVPPTPGFQPGASSVRSTYSFTYTLNGDGTFTIDTVPGTFLGEALIGTRAGQSLTVANRPTLTGLISRTGDTLTVATLTPKVQTNTWSTGGVVNDRLIQVCHRSAVLIKQ
jgi:hypothetical protein